MAFDCRFDPDVEYWQGPGTRSARDWLRDLRSYQAVCGFGEVPPKTHEPFGPLAQWVQRMRRYADSGKLPFEIAAELAVMGVPLELDRAKQKTAATQEDNSFERNLAQLQDWIRAEVTPVANLTYLESREDTMARQCYTFLEHMRLKRRQGVLKPDHLKTLRALALQINGASIKDWLAPNESLRDIEKMAAQGEDLCPLPWTTMGAAAVAAWLERAAREQWRPAVYVPGLGVEPVDLGRMNRVFTTQPLAVRGDASGTLMLYGARNTAPTLIFRMRQPAERLTTLPVRVAPMPTRTGPDTGPGKLLDTGARFGALTILERVMRPAGEKRSGHFYRCRCDCGEIVVRQRDTIVTREYATCGCGIQRNLAGRVYGRLTVLNEYRRIDGPGRNTEWKVTCACGNQSWVRASALKSGKTRSCGCLRGQARAA